MALFASYYNSLHYCKHLVLNELSDIVIIFDFLINCIVHNLTIFILNFNNVLSSSGLINAI